MKKRLISAALALVLALSLLPGAALAAGRHPFRDIPKTHWANDAVQYVYDNDLMNGIDAVTFSPDGTSTRAMLVTILYRMAGEPAYKAQARIAPNFKDVIPGTWYYDAVRWAAVNDIVGGYGDGRFGANDKITREQLSVILYRYAGKKGYDVSAQANLSGYKDVSAISSYATKAIAWANGVGLITGVLPTTLAPQGAATRAQAAVILTRFCRNVVPTGGVSTQQMVKNIKNSSLRKKDTLAVMGEVLLENGFAPAFVAGVLGNIIEEGACGVFESSAYVSNPDLEPPYLVYLDENYDYRNTYSGQYIYNGFRLSEVENLILELGPGGADGRGSCFGLGCFQWTSYDRIKRLIGNYIDAAGGADTITLAQVQEAEGVTISYELNGPYNRVYTAWKADNPKQDNADAAYAAGVKVCTSYGIPMGYNTPAVQETRGGNAAKVYAVMLGT